jgi:small-conductance mechanosensitive channel
MQPKLRWLWLVPLALGLAAAHAATLDARILPAAGDAGAADQTDAAVPLSAREVPGRADTDEQFASDVLGRLARPGTAATTLEPRLEAIVAEVATLARRVRQADLSKLPAVRLEGLQRNWRFYDRQLSAWQRDWQRQFDSYSGEAAQLATRRATWLATRERFDVIAVPPALLERVDEVLARIDAADRALTDPLERLFELGRRRTNAAGSIEAGLEAVEVASAGYGSTLLVRDSPPLPVAWEESRGVPDAAPSAASAVALDREFLRRYLAASRDRLAVHAMIAVLLLPVLIRLRRSAQRLVQEDPAIRASTQALLRPISAWLVLVMVASLVIHSDAPIVLHEAALLLAVIPVLRLLPRTVFDALGPWPYIATALYVLQRLGVLFVAPPLWHRVHLLIVTLLALGALVWILFEVRGRKPAAQASAAERLTRLAGALGVVALAVSALANLLGNTTLAEFLTQGTLDSAYIGLVLYAGASVLGSITRHVATRGGTSRFRSIALRAAPVLTTVARLIGYGAAVAWVLLALSEFRILRPIRHWLAGVLSYPLGYGEISLTLGTVLLFLGSVYVAFWIARTMRTILRDDVLGRMHLPRGVANSVSTLTYYALVTIGVLIALAAAGFEVGQLAIVVGALSVGIGFGLQNVVNNFVSGLILMFERPIQPGDVVELTGTTGRVRAIGMRATTLTTAEGADVVVPNGTLLSEKLINWTLQDTGRRIDIDVGVAYGSDPKRVIDLLKEVAAATPGVGAKPPPEVLLKSFGPTSLVVGIMAWVDVFATAHTVRSDLAVRAYEALARADVQIPLPHQNVTIRSLSAPKEPAAVGPAAAPRS